MSRSPARPKRSTSRSDQTRSTLLAVAEKAFADKGYSGARLVAVSKAANANIAAISYHFGGKRALYEAVLDASGKRFRALCDDLLAQGLTGGLDGLLARVWHTMRAESDHVRMVTRALLEQQDLPEGATWIGRELLPEVCEAWAPALGVTPDRLRMAIISMNDLISRYAISGDDDLRFLTGAADDADLDAEVVAYLTRLARRLLGMPEAG